MTESQNDDRPFAEQLHDVLIGKIKTNRETLLDRVADPGLLDGDNLEIIRKAANMRTTDPEMQVCKMLAVSWLFDTAKRCCVDYKEQPASE